MLILFLTYRLLPLPSFFRCFDKGTHVSGLGARLVLDLHNYARTPCFNISIAPPSSRLALHFESKCGHLTRLTPNFRLLMSTARLSTTLLLEVRRLPFYYFIQTIRKQILICIAGPRRHIRLRHRFPSFRGPLGVGPRPREGRRKRPLS